MIKTKSDKFAEQERELKANVIKELRKHAPKKKMELEQSFEDEANNDITAIDKDNVYFNDSVDSYPLSGLGITDAIYLLSVVE